MQRRTFVTAMAAAPAAKTGQRRPKPIRAGFWGTQYYDEKEREQLLDVLESQSPFRWYGSTKQPPAKVSTFEREFARRMQTKYALAVTSGTAALQTAVNALAIGPGDEVIMPAWTWHSCYAAVVLAGALPVFAEIDRSFNIDPGGIERHITPATKLIMAVHLQGTPCDMDRILPIARKHGVKVLEDCAQSVGASYKGKPVGSMADIGIYSLQLNKTITAGEGGAVVTNDAALFERATRFHDIGMLREPHQQLLGTPQVNPFVGCNFRLNEFSGGVLLAQLRKLDRVVGDVRANAKVVYEALRDLPGARFRFTPDPEGELGTGVFFEFKSKEQCDRFKEVSKAEGAITANPGGSAILPIQPYIMQKATAHPNWPTFNTPRGRAIQYGPEICPKTIDILSRFAGPLMDPKFTRDDLEEIIAATRKAYVAAA
ncbi:MAG: DegT/DnrJ/EryC1/StrS family aminotransferase [Bryobacterales bacterium]|nr:DegT/DnrJ/EryC1/StrS family aminotransferase [Bryobacterales bacterium]